VATLALIASGAKSTIRVARRTAMVRSTTTVPWATKTNRLVVIALISVSASTSNFAHAAVYQITEFGSDIRAVALNNVGQVVGALRRAPDSSSIDHPFYWNPDAPNGIAGTLTELPILASSNSGGKALGINDAGEIVGSSDSVVQPNLISRAVLWSPTPGGPNTHEIHDLGNPVESEASYRAVAINSSGQVVGNKITPGILFNGWAGVSSSFVWTPQTANGSVGSLRGVPSGPSPYTGNAAYDINDSAQTSGSVFKIGISFGSKSRADVWSTASPSSVPPTDLGFPPGDWVNAFGLSVNKRGQVVGYLEDTIGAEHGFLWTPDTPNGTTGVMRALDGMTAAIDINDAGQVVGYGGVQAHAILWSDSSGAVDLNSLVPSLPGRTITRARAINNKGQILADAWNFDIETVMLTPLVGDYDHDGVVDAADYTVWRDTLYSTTDLAADGNGNGTVDYGDYEVWKSNFGNQLSSGTGASSAIPEPTALSLLLAGILTMCVRGRPKVS
jgi:probable HAF family extracellular repeat protein